MDGAAERMRHERAMVWWGAMLPYLKKPPKFEEFTGQKKNRVNDLQACIAAWDRIDRALSANRKKR